MDLNQKISGQSKGDRGTYGEVLLRIANVRYILFNGSSDTRIRIEGGLDYVHVHREGSNLCKSFTICLS